MKVSQNLLSHLASWSKPDILVIGENTQNKQNKIVEQFREQIPGASIKEWQIAQLFTSSKQETQCLFHCIYIEPEIGMKYGAAILQELSRWLSLLQPCGLFCSAVYGYVGYYGLVMLHDLCEPFLSRDFSPSVMRALVSNLSPQHPAFFQKEFMAQLLKGDMATMQRLLTISQANVFSVSRLLSIISQQGGVFLDWLFPGFYQFELGFTLPVPEKWEVAELLQVVPLEHRFIVTTPHA